MVGKCDPPNSIKIRAISYANSAMDVLSDFMGEFSFDGDS